MMEKTFHSGNCSSNGDENGNSEAKPEEDAAMKIGERNG